MCLETNKLKILLIGMATFKKNSRSISLDGNLKQKTKGRKKKRKNWWKKVQAWMNFVQLDFKTK